MKTAPLKSLKKARKPAPSKGVSRQASNSASNAATQNLLSDKLSDKLSDAQVRSLAQSLLAQLNAQSAQLGQQSAQLGQQSAQLSQQTRELAFRQTKIDALTHEIRVLRHFRFGAKTEGLDSAQSKLFEEAHAEDLSAAEHQLAALALPTSRPRTPSVPKRQSLPAHLPRVDIVHEPHDTTCACGQCLVRIGQDVSERLDYVPGHFQVERHIRGVWACKACAHMRQTAAPVQLIEGGLPTARLLAHVLVSKYDDHLPLYRQQEIYARLGLDLSLSTLCDWVGAAALALAPLVQALKVQLLRCRVLHADESLITILMRRASGKNQKTPQTQSAGKQRGYIWAYASGQGEPIKAVVYEVKPSRAGTHVREFLQRHHAPEHPGGHAHSTPWAGYLVVDDYAGYKALFAPGGGVANSDHDPASPQGITEVGCWAHVRRKFFELHTAAQSTLGATALAHIGVLYEVERQIREQNLGPSEALALRQAQGAPRLRALHDWLRAQRDQLTDGTASARAIDYALKRWEALTLYASDASLPIDNNRVENLIRPWALGRKNWLFAGSLSAGERSADIMSLIESAKMNGHDPMAYLSDVLARLPTHPNSRIEELLPTSWRQESGATL
jgi:transposase